MSTNAQSGGRASRAVAAIVGISMLTGCSSTFEISFDQVPHLSVSAPEPQVVKTVEGDTETLKSSFKVTVVPRTRIYPYARDVDFTSPMSAEIQGETLVFASVGDPRPLVFPMRAVDAIRIRQISTGKTIGLVLGCVAAGAAFIGLTYLIIHNVSFG